MVRQAFATRTGSKGEAVIRISDLLHLAVCFGLVTGLVEGLGLLAVFGHGWLNSNIRAGVSLEIVWIAALFDLLLFLGLALLVWSGGSLIAQLRRLQVVIGLFALVTFVDWTALTGRVGPVAVLVLAAGLSSATYRCSRRYMKSLSCHLRQITACAVIVTLVTGLAIEIIPTVQEHRATARLARLSSGAPNVLVVVIDTLRADHMPLYGYPRQTMPTAERIANQGVTFDNDISASSWTLPSHASMLTGRYPHEHGADGEHPLDARFPTLPEVLRAQGYRTGGFSANLFYFSRRAGFSRGFIHFQDYFYSLGDMFYRTLWGRIFNKYAPDTPRWDEFPTRKQAAEVNRELFQWIDSSPRKPFFAFINYFDLHEPYLVLEPYRSRFRNLPPGDACGPNFTPADQQILRNDNPYLYRLAHMSCTEFQRQVDAYDGAAYFADQQLANLFVQLRQRGLDKNTLVVITSDHGEAFGDHGLLTHRNALYRELIHVPLIYWWPGKIPAGVRVSRPVSSTSLPSTILSLVGIENRVFPGPPISRLWQHPELAADWPYPISEMAQNLYIPKSYPAHEGWLKTIVTPEWQLIISQRLSPDLYDWNSDPRELHNLAAVSAEQATLHQLKSVLWNQVTQAQSVLSSRRTIAEDRRRHISVSKATSNP